MLAGCESIQVFKNRLNENLSEMVQMKQSCLRNKRFGMETKLFYVLPLPSPHKSYCFVGIPHTSKKIKTLTYESLSVTVTSPHLKVAFPSVPSPSCYNSPCTLLSWHLCIAGKSEGNAKGEQAWHRGRKRNFASPPGMGGIGRLRHKTHTMAWRLLSREEAADELSGGTEMESWPKDSYQTTDTHQAKPQQSSHYSQCCTEGFKAATATCIIISADYMGGRHAKVIAGRLANFMLALHVFPGQSLPFTSKKLKRNMWIFVFNSHYLWAGEFTFFL